MQRAMSRSSSEAGSANAASARKRSASSARISRAVGGPSQIGWTPAFGVAAFPYFQGGKALTPTGSWFIGVAANSANKDIAADFAKFLTLSDEGTKMWFDANKQLPAYKPLLEQISKSPEFDAFPQDVFRIGVYDALNTAKPRPTTVAYGQLQDAFRTAFADMSNGVPVNDALTTAVETYDAAMKRVAQ
jgi:maltose-binding protein MalE